MMKMMIEGREVNPKSCQIANVNMSDYPDFCDAYIAYAEFVDGSELNENQLELMHYEYCGFVNELAHNSTH